MNSNIRTRATTALLVLFALMLASGGFYVYKKTVGFDRYDPDIILSISAIYPSYSVAEKAALSNLVLEGEVLGFSNPFMIDPVDDAEPMYFTDMYVLVESVYKGDPLPSETADLAISSTSGTIIAVRFKGGYDDTLAVESGDSSPGLITGDKALLFLYRISDGSDYNTEGNHYYLTSGRSSAVKKSPDGSFMQPYGDAISIDDIKQSIVEANAMVEKEAAGKSPDPRLLCNGVMNAEVLMKIIDKASNDGGMPTDAIEAERKRVKLAESEFGRVMTAAEIDAYEKELMESLEESSVVN